MSVFLQSHHTYRYVLILLTLQLGIWNVYCFNPDDYKPHDWKWNWEVYTKHFDNIPDEPCPDASPICQCICKSDLRKSMHLVDCSVGAEMKPPYFDQVPVSDNTTHMILSCYILYLPNRSFVNLTRLIYLDLSKNLLLHIGSGAFEGLANLTVLRLHMNQLGHIQSKTFECLTNLIALDLSENHLEYFESHTFKFLIKLIALDLSNNNLETIGSNAFKNLSNLEYLELSGNHLHLPSAFLRPLSSLTTLLIECIAGEIPELKQLEYLAISSDYVTEKDILQLQNTTVTHLLIGGLKIGIEQGAFCNWKALKYLELIPLNRWGSYGNDVFKNVSGLQTERLYISNLLTDTINLDGFKAPNLKALAIYHGEVEIIMNVPPLNNLQWLNVRQNKLREFDMYEMYLPQLHYFNISHQTSTSACNSILPESLIFLDAEGTQLEKWSPECFFSSEFVNLRNTGIDQFINERSVCVTDIVTIKHLDMRDNNIECIDSSVFSQDDWSTLNVLKLSNNQLGSDDSEECREIQRLYFMNFLKPFWNLTHLYLDANYMKYDLPHDMLHNQTKLQSLNISDMFLTNLTVEIGHLKDLKFLDLSQNKIQCLYTSTMRDINTIVHYTPGKRNISKLFEINLSHNPLQCTCSCLEFYQWMGNVRQYITFTDFNSYECTFDDGQKVNLIDIDLMVNILHSQCVSTDWSLVIMTTTAIITVYLFIFAVTTLFRFRHTLRYLWLKHKMHRLHLERNLLDPKYNFDAFVSCERQDAIWVKRNFLPKLENEQTGLKFCVAQRNFLVGGTIIDNIVRSTNQSRKVVYVISQNFLRSGWCKEELLMGHQESLSRGKNIIICIFMPDIIHNQLSDRLRFILNHVTCIKWPRDPAAQQVFWILLHRALLDGHPNRNEI